MPFCVIADGDIRFDGELVRVKGTTMVARVDLHRRWINGQFLVTLKVFAIDRVEPPNQRSKFSASAPPRFMG